MGIIGLHFFAEEFIVATFARHCDVEWNGTLMEGNGVVKAGTGAFTQPVTFPSRIGEGDGKTTPEELLAGSHAVCYAMGFAATIGRQGGKAARLRVTATVTADKGEAGIKIMSSHLKAVVEGLEGIDRGKLDEIAKTAEQRCPISNAIRGNVNITVESQAV
jgi:osmotically inducible protein OsmC